MSRRFQGRQGKGQQPAYQRRSSSFSSSCSTTMAQGRTADSWTREVERRMREWGVDPTLDDNDFDEPAPGRRFRSDIIAFCQKVADGAYPLETSANLLEMLPEGPVDAMRVVLDQEIRALLSNDGLVEVTDRLFEPYGLPSHIPPYKFSNGKYQLRPEYENSDLPKDDEETLRRLLNPLERFRYERVDAREKLERQFVSEGDPGSVAVRAIVAHGACRFAKCVHCAASGQLRWNGYYGASVQFRYWKKLVCKNCCSVYEIKSAKTAEEALRKMNSLISGGNFLEQYAAVQQELSDTPAPAGSTCGGPRQYVALLCTDEKVFDVDTGEECWPVYVGRVHKVLPLLKDRSFDLSSGGDRPKVYTRIICEKKWMAREWEDDAGVLWFKTPVFEYDARQIASEIIDTL